MKIFARPININSADQNFCEIEVKKTQNLREVYQLFQTVLGEDLNCTEDEYDYQIERIAIVQESRPNTKLAVTALIQDIVREGKSDRFTFIFPREGLPIVQIHDGANYYYVDNYGRNELLYFIVEKEKEIKTMIEKGEYEYIKINGQMVDYQAEKNKPFKGFLENRMNTMVSISIKLKAKKEASESGTKESAEKKVEEIKADKTKKQPLREIIEEERSNNIEQKKEEKKEERVQRVQPSLPLQEPQVPANTIKQQPNKDPLKLVIKFQSNTSNKKQQFCLPVDPTKSMLQLLPQILKQLKSRGFHWQEEGFDTKRGDKDKLSIIYAGYQFKKLERPFRSFINFPQEKSMIFTFERHYDGGALG